MTRTLRFAVAGLLGLALWQLAAGLWIPAKAALAQTLIERAWRAARAGTPEARPWPWADTWPVARLEAPAAGEKVYVLADASGRSLAFGPGHLAGTATPGTPGLSVIAAHRDTHFRFLRRLSAGDWLFVERADGARIAYRVTDMRIVDARTARIFDEIERPTLALVTCYPFDGLWPGTPLRYVVTAEAESVAR
ncbi:MAG TPA: class GN sortase [Alphaproteobacteria bacterium]|jgi:sortase A|nr:class GN sortase [Alphaproteobacteria bacterium]